jgi:cytoskeletal protein CcmA (bactofilin family)
MNERDFEMKLTIIGSKMQLNGELYSSDDIRVDGSYSGNIRTKGKLVVSKEGFVSGIVHAKDITIQGRSEGEFVSENTFRIDPGGYFEGSARTRFMSITESARFNGTCAIIPDGDFRVKDKELCRPEVSAEQFINKSEEKLIQEAGDLKEAESEKGDKRISEEKENENEIFREEKQNSIFSNSLSRLKSL